MQSLGARIRQLRHQRDLTLEGLGESAGISAAHLSDIELGRRRPSPKVIAKLAAALGATQQGLLEFDPRTYLDEIREVLELVPAAGPKLAAAAVKIAEFQRRHGAADFEIAVEVRHKK